MLSDEEIKQLDFDNCGSLSFAENQMAFARAIEAAVLAKMQAQSEPVAWLHSETNQAFTTEPPPGLKALCTPLFTLPAPVQQEPAHTDHPARHYDRTCAACQQDCNCADQTDCDGKCCKPVQQDVNQQLLEALKQMVEAITGVDQISAVNEARAAIAQAEKEMK